MIMSWMKPLCCVVVQQFKTLLVAYVFFKTDPNERGNQNNLDKVLDEDLMAGLIHCNSVNKIKIMGAIVHPLFQNIKRMVGCNLCTKKRHNAGMEELLCRMKWMIDFLSSNSIEIIEDRSKVTPPLRQQPKVPPTPANAYAYPKFVCIINCEVCHLYSL